MKFFAPLVVGILAFISSQVDANGVCYDPNHGTGMDASSVQADMQTIASHGFDSVRTFISAFGGVEIGPIIAAAGLKAMLGVPYPQNDYKDQMAAAIKAAQAGGVYAIMVGNENLAGASSVPGDMISVIQQIKSQVPKGVLVGTVQRNTEAIEHNGVAGWWDLVSACDIFGVNAHPYFTPNTVVDNAIQVLNNQWQTMSGTYGSKLILTETGWPSSGNLMGNVGSVAGAELFYNAYQQWSSSMGEKFYFQMFDTPYRTEEFEKNFGVVTSNGQNKFGMSVQASVSIGQTNQQDNQQNTQQNGQQDNQQQQQQQTPTPTQPPAQATQPPAQATQPPAQATQPPATQPPATQAPATETQTQPPATKPHQRNRLLLKLLRLKLRLRPPPRWRPRLQPRCRRRPLRSTRTRVRVTTTTPLPVRSKFRLIRLQPQRRLQGLQTTNSRPSRVRQAQVRSRLLRMLPRPAPTPKLRTTSSRPTPKAAVAVQEPLWRLPLLLLLVLLWWPSASSTNLASVLPSSRMPRPSTMVSRSPRSNTTLLYKQFSSFTLQEH